MSYLKRRERMEKKSKLWKYYLLLAIIIQITFSTADSKGLFRTMAFSSYKILYGIMLVVVNGLFWLAMYTGRKIVDATAHKWLHLFLTVGTILAPPSILYALIRLILS